MLVTVAAFREPWEAHMFASRLEAEGVPAYILHEYHVWNAWHYSNALGGVKVQVSDEQRAEAKQIELSCRQDGFRSLLEAEFGSLDDLRCPKCGAQDSWKRRPVVATIVAAVMLPLGVPVPPTNWVYFCNRCATRFVERPWQVTLDRWKTRSVAIGVTYPLLLGLMLIAYLLQKRYWRLELVIIILIAAGLSVRRRWAVDEEGEGQ